MFFNKFVLIENNDGLETQVDVHVGVTKNYFPRIALNKTLYKVLCSCRQKVFSFWGHLQTKLHV